MAKMKVSEIQAQVKETVFEQIKALFAESGEQYGDYEIAVPVTVDGNECWGKISVVCGQLKDTTKTKAFDPFVAREAWALDKEVKARLAETKAKAKADRDKAKNKGKASEEA